MYLINLESIKINWNYMRSQEHFLRDNTFEYSYSTSFLIHCSLGDYHNIIYIVYL